MSTPNIIRWDQAYNRNGDPKLPRAAVNVIRTYMDNHTLAGYVTQATIVDATGLDITNVRRQIKANVERGWLVITHRGRSGRASEYRLLFPQPGIGARLEGEVTRHECLVEDQEPNRANTPGYTVQSGTNARLLPGADAPPTSPELLLKRSSLDNPDPLGDRGLDDFRHCSTSPDQPGTNARLEPGTYARLPPLPPSHADPFVEDKQATAIQLHPVPWAD